MRSIEPAGRETRQTRAIYERRNGTRGPERTETELSLSFENLDFKIISLVMGCSPHTASGNFMDANLKQMTQVSWQVYALQYNNVQKPGLDP
jgi:hypothetical protein